MLRTAANMLFTRTEKGREILTKIGQIARQHQDALCASLTGEEREKLAELLRKIADAQGLTCTYPR